MAVIVRIAATATEEWLRSQFPVDTTKVPPAALLPENHRIAAVEFREDWVEFKLEDPSEPANPTPVAVRLTYDNGDAPIVVTTARKLYIPYVQIVDGEVSLEGGHVVKVEVLDDEHKVVRTVDRPEMPPDGVGQWFVEVR